jgi:hypothetical protein
MVKISNSGMAASRWLALAAVAWQPWRWRWRWLASLALAAMAASAAWRKQPQSMEWHRHRYQRISVAAYGIISENNQRGVWRQMAASGNMKAAAKMAAGSHQRPGVMAAISSASGGWRRRDFISRGGSQAAAKLSMAKMANDGESNG